MSRIITQPCSMQIDVSISDKEKSGQEIRTARNEHMHALEYVAVTQHSGTIKTAESGCPGFGIQDKRVIGMLRKK